MLAGVISVILGSISNDVDLMVVWFSYFKVVLFPYLLAASLEIEPNKA